VDDHKRSCTPSEAIRLGADYLVVGRPIRDANTVECHRRAARLLCQLRSTMRRDERSLRVGPNDRRGTACWPQPPPPSRAAPSGPGSGENMIG
jgi:hypothetical protein